MFQNFVRNFERQFLSAVRDLAEWMLIIFLSISLSADEPGTAILRTDGVGTFVNGSRAPASIALFTNDFIETEKNATARIQLPGSAAGVDGETVLQFGSDELALDHGSLSVYTNIGLRVRVGCLTVIPVNPSRDSCESFD